MGYDISTTGTDIRIVKDNLPQTVAIYFVLVP